MNTRQIKFRGIRVDNGEWVYGSLVNNLWTYASHHSYYPNPVCEIITGKYEGDCWQDVAEDEENAIVTVIPETVGQLTGLKDKNNKEIYEGDIVLCFGKTKEFQRVVSFNYGAYGYNSDDYFISFAGNTNFMWEDNQSEGIEIIGNIYEHKHLLEEKTKTA